MTLFVALILLGLQLTGYRTGCVMRHITKAALVVSLYLCIYAYLHWLLLKGHVLTGPFENPNVLALHLCLLLPFVHDESIVNKRRLVLRLMNISAEVLCIITVLFTECQSVEINENDSVQENGQNKSALKTVQTYPPISDICQGILNVSVGIEGRGY